MTKARALHPKDDADPMTQWLNNFWIGIFTSSIILFFDDQFNRNRISAKQLLIEKLSRLDHSLIYKLGVCVKSTFLDLKKGNLISAVKPVTRYHFCEPYDDYDYLILHSVCYTVCRTHTNYVNNTRKNSDYLQLRRS